MFVVSSQSPVKSLPELLKFIKDNPGKITYGTTGEGSPQQLATLLFAQTAGSRESHMRTRNENLPVNESSQQFVPRGYRRSRVDVEGNTDLRMFQLDALGMNDVTPE